ncbi:MAG TPA: hypothetical protein VK973_03405 [Arenicellales bacterium]|nr:hypothetical protein [Arenicellales bacterium]
MQYRPAELNENKLKEIQALEAELGKTVVAVESQPEPASMTPAQLDRLKKAETDLGVVLVAFEKQSA